MSKDSKNGDIARGRNYDYLCTKVYENIKTRPNGRLYIGTYYVKKVAEMLGGRYEDLTEIQKTLLRSDIVDESINLDGGIFRYTRA